MIKPGYAHTDLEYVYIDHQEGMTRESLPKMLQVGDKSGTLVAWNGQSFEVLTCIIETSQEDNAGVWQIRISDTEIDLVLTHTFEASMHVYYPIDQRSKAKDWQGAIRQFLNEEKDAWLPEHCTVDFHYDRELTVEGIARSLFGGEIENLQQDCLTKMATIVRRPTDSSARSRELAARVKLDNLMTVRDHFVECIEKDVRRRPIGWYHQNPLAPHLHREMAGCLEKAIFIHKFTHSAVYASVAGEINRVLAKLKQRHPYERTWERDARIERERKEQEAKREAASE